MKNQASINEEKQEKDFHHPNTQIIKYAKGNEYCYTLLNYTQRATVTV